MDSILTLKDLSINGKKVLMRVDFNVPFTSSGVISDDTRIQAALPSVNWVLDHGGALILMSHLGRPKGKPSEALSLRGVAQRLSELLKRPVQFVSDSTGKEVQKSVKALQPGEVLLLENLRFNRAEENPKVDPSFAKDLAKLGDFYVNDAFGSSHRAHSSITEVPQYFGPSKGMGLLMEKEIKELEKLIKTPQRPFIAILGGVKLSTKLAVVEALAGVADKVLVGGAMAFTFLKMQGVSIGDSLVEEDVLIASLDNLILPKDFLCVKNEETAVFSVKEGIPKGYKGVDIGPETVECFKEEIAKAKSLFWNGPMGLFEDPRFSRGTFAVMEAVVQASAFKVIGGGDSLAMVNESGLGSKIDHLSTGGGASLKFLEKGRLPGLDILKL